VLEYLERPDEAQPLYLELLERDPAWVEASFRLGYLRIQRGDYRGAVDAFGACLKLRPAWVQARLNLAFAYFKLEELEAARREFETVLESDPESIEALRGIAEISVVKTDYTLALDACRRLIALQRAPEYLYNAGLLFQREGLLEEACRFYEQALAEKPEFPEACLNLGHALSALGRDKEALQYWRSALELRPELAAGYFSGTAA